MAGRRKAIELAMSEVDLAALRAIARSRSESASRVERARMLLAYWDEPSFFKVGRAVGAHHQTVQRCVERALVYGPMAALDDRPRRGKEPTMTAEAKAWVVDLACRKAKELGYPHELWTTRLLARHAREHGPAEGHACLAKLAQGTLCKILNEQEIKPLQCGTVLRHPAALVQAAKGKVAASVGSIAIGGIVCSSLTLAGVLYPCRATSQVSL